jgi:hypothetical protein
LDRDALLVVDVVADESVPQSVPPYPVEQTQAPFTNWPLFLHVVDAPVPDTGDSDPVLEPVVDALDWPELPL